MFSFTLSLCCVLISLVGILDAKVHQLLEGPHFHDLLQDLPPGLRPHSVIAFYNKSCESELQSMGFGSHGFPGIHDVLFGRYEMSTFEDRVWYEKEPHIDLAKLLGAEDHIASFEGNACPSIAFVPVEYAEEIGYWYKIFPDKSQVVFWDHKQKWRHWLWSQLKQTVRIYHDTPIVTEIMVRHGSEILGLKNREVKLKMTGFESHINVDVYPGDVIEIISPVSVNVDTDGRVDSPKTVATIYPGMKGLEISTNMQTRITEFNMADHKLRLDQLSEQWARARHGTTMMTHVRNLMLPTRVPKHDKMGFKKIKMPDEINFRLQRYYRAHWFEQRLEEWDSSGTQLNFFDVKTHMVSLDNDWQERDRIGQLIQPLLEEWSGEHELELTAFYGIREYSRGASLRNHVDRVDTHVYSAICQIGQTGIDSPWPLEVYGFDGKNYEVTLEPGEMILYESASMIHGRPRPFNGTRYANAFVHFRPLGWEYNSNKLWGMTTKPTLEDLGVSWNSIYS